MKAVIDRFEGDNAVVLFGDEEVKADIPRFLLPADAQEGSWLKVTFETDHETTGERKERIENKLARLKSKGRETGNE